MLENHSFPKDSRLKSRKSIELLFANGKSYYKYPIKCIYLEQGQLDTHGFKMAVSVPKKLIPTAVKRNLLKRRIREAYRQNKQLLSTKINSENFSLIFMLIYVGKDIADYQTLEKSVKRHLQHLNAVIN